MTVLRKIISGAQTGADMGGLRAAKKLGLETGGWMPKDFKTEAGNKPEYAKLYGVESTMLANYKIRTELNVNDSDGTILFGKMYSAGSKLTKFLAHKHDKPTMIVTSKTSTNEVFEWARDNNIAVLNVAGNRESVSPGIEDRVEEFLIEAFGL